SNKRKPARKCRPDQWEIQHIHDAAMQKGAVSTVKSSGCYATVCLRKIVKLGIVMHALVKDHPIKHAINQVTQSTRINQCRANNETFMIIVSHNSTKVPCPKNNGG